MDREQTSGVREAAQIEVNKALLHELAEDN